MVYGCDKEDNVRKSLNSGASGECYTLLVWTMCRILRCSGGLEVVEVF